MKLSIGLGILIAGFVLASLCLTAEGALALYFGWILYLYRVLPRVSLNGPTLMLGVVALVMFATGIHIAGRRLAGRAHAPLDKEVRFWRVGWTLSIVASVMVLFAAGISAVGIVHQLTWLATAEEPLLVESIPGDNGLFGSNSTMSYMRWLGLGMANYESTDGHLPPGGSFTPDGQMLHSWETHLLPYVGYFSARAIDMKKPWNDATNQRAFQGVLPIFVNDTLRGAPLKDEEGFGLSHYAVNQWVLAGNKFMKTSEIKDGPANTLLIGQVNSEFKPWGHPVNWRDPTLGINQVPNGFGGASSAGGAMFLMADGSVRFLKDSIDPAVLRALSTPCGGEAVE